MQIYKVGGAVRDRLLGQPVTDIDWVVVGATTEAPPAPPPSSGTDGPPSDEPDEAAKRARSHVH